MCLLCNMDDYSVASLVESKNEWCARLVNILTPAVITGLKSIFEEAITLCIENGEEDKYLMTFQTFLTRIPKWNNTIIECERVRICEISSCSYLEDLISCVHIIHLKALTCIRVGQEQKKVDIDIPALGDFVHRVYIAVARKVYVNVYLFEKDIAPLEIQKHNRELELIIKECILNSIRDSMPIEDILKAYISHTEEEEVNVKEEVFETPVSNPHTTEVKNPEPESKNNVDLTISETDKGLQPLVDIPPVNIDEKKIDVPNKLSFSDLDKTIDTSGIESTINAPKTDERLDKIAKETAQRRKEEEDNDEDSLKIGDIIPLEHSDINDLNKSIDIKPPPEIHIDTLPLP